MNVENKVNTAVHELTKIKSERMALQVEADVLGQKLDLLNQKLSEVWTEERAAAETLNKAVDELAGRLR